MRVKSTRFGSGSTPAVSPCSERDDASRRTFVRLAQRRSDLVAIHVRHGNVQEHHIGSQPICRRQRVDAIASENDLMPLQAQQLRHKLRSVRVVIDH